METQSEVAPQGHQLHWSGSDTAIEGGHWMAALSIISGRFIEKNRRERSPTEMFTQTVGDHTILAFKQTLNFLFMCT